MYNSESAPASSSSLLDESPLAQLNPEIFAAIEKEKKRQRTHIELIASENFTLPAVIEATGSVLTNKYAEGYPGKRYYGVVNMSILLKVLLSKERKRFSELNMPMYRHILEVRQILLFILQCFSPVTKS